jgi:hypothetical protein
MENTEQQLALISQMISTARKQFTDNSFIYLLWGWAVALAALAEFALMEAKFGNHAIVWLVAIPVALVGQVVFLSRRKKKEQAVSHMDKVMGYIWVAVGASMAVVLSSQGVMQMSTYPALILLYGIGTFISGALMNLKPMQVGAVCCWIISAVAFHVTFEYQLLLLSLSLILSYIIPGHILQNRFRKQHV